MVMINMICSLLVSQYTLLYSSYAYDYYNLGCQRFLDKTQKKISVKSFGLRMKSSRLRIEILKFLV